jgi:hypothetical protein
MYIEFTWNHVVLLHEAQQLGIRPTSSEITTFVKTLPRFKGEAGGFDIEKYNEFTKTTLPSFGFNESQIEEVVSDQLTLNRLKDLLGAGVQVPESEDKENYERAYGKMDIAVVRLREEDFQKDLKITDEDVAKYYEARKDQLKSEEKRKIEFVAFTLGDEEKKLTGKDRKDPLQKQADRANDFSQALLEKDAKFADVAAKFQAPVTATEDFTNVAPDPKIASTPQLSQYSFQLTMQAPISDPIQGQDGFYIVHLLGVTEARPLTLEEAKPKITETMKSERLRELVSNKGAEVARQIREALKAGTPLDRAVEPSGLKLERIAGVSLVEQPDPKPELTKLIPDLEKPKPKNEAPDLPSIKNSVAVLSPGEVTDFVPVVKGGVVAVLEKRAPADPEGYAASKAQFETRYLSQRRGIIFMEWMRDRRRAANAALTPAAG